jgi:hypothetical protein
MKKKKIWFSVLPLSILGAMIVGIFLLGKFSATLDKKIEENGEWTIGTTIDKGGKRIIRVRYEANGQSFIKGTGKPFSYIQPNEQYKIKYLPKDPESIVVFFDQPFIAKEQKYSETECISISKELSVVSFEYIVNGKKTKRETLYRNHQLSVTNYRVVYRTDNPLIGYLIEK